MSKNTKEALVAAFLELVGQSLEKVTVTDIVEKCQISRQTFYYHFDDINSMLIWAFESEIKRICINQNPDFMEKAEKGFVEFFNKYDVMFRKSLKSHKLIFVFNLINKCFYDYIVSYISVKRNEEQNPGKNADYVISYTAGAFTALIIKTIQSEKSDYETIVDNLSSSLQGI